MTTSELLYSYRRHKSFYRCGDDLDCIEKIERMFSKTWAVKPVKNATDLQNQIEELIKHENRIYSRSVAVEIHQVKGTKVEAVFEKDIFGKPIKVRDGFYKKPSATLGVSDMRITIPIKPPLVVTWAVEIKFGKDTQKEAQQRFEDMFTSAGGLYSIVRNLDDFYTQYTKIINLYK